MNNEILVSSGIMVTLAIVAVIFVVRCTVVNLETTDYDPAMAIEQFQTPPPPISVFSTTSSSKVVLTSSTSPSPKLDESSLVEIPITSEIRNKSNQEDSDVIVHHQPSELERAAWSQDII
jgi:hypothetical protein